MTTFVIENISVYDATSGRIIDVPANRLTTEQVEGLSLDQRWRYQRAIASLEEAQRDEERRLAKMDSCRRMQAARTATAEHQERERKKLEEAAAKMGKPVWDPRHGWVRRPVAAA